MTPERNEPCPCGSGKKYKKCHGLAAPPQKPDYIALNRAVAYKGAVGRARAEFCQDYAARKQAQIAAIGAKLHDDLAAQGQAISCGRGCAHCCHLFVVASLQECEAIVYYLYEHEEVLQHFLQSFPAWRDCILQNERCFRRINQLHERITLNVATAEESQRFDEECGNYARAYIPCPFLKDKACTIYPVRPYVCAEVVAVTPSDWCNPAHPRNTEVHYFKASFKRADDMPYFAHPKSNQIFSSLPFLVYRLLEEGYDALATVPGLEFIKQDARRDPEVRELLG